ncbi:unnamed protein product [Schistosoma curassoni]|nr:unnamed protein product [Schistosoma curassoni]
MYTKLFSNTISSFEPNSVFSPVTYALDDMYSEINNTMVAFIISRNYCEILIYITQKQFHLITTSKCSSNTPFS